MRQQPPEKLLQLRAKTDLQLVALIQSRLDVEDEQATAEAERLLRVVSQEHRRGLESRLDEVRRGQSKAHGASSY